MEVLRLRVSLCAVTLLAVGLLSTLACSSYSPLTKAAATAPQPVPTTVITTTVASAASAGSVANSANSTTAAPTTVATRSPTTSPATTNTTRPPTTTEFTPRPVLDFDGSKAMGHVEKLAAEIGIRRGGTEEELTASQYAYDYLSSLGYEVTMVAVPVPNGLTTHNVVAIKEGASPLTMVVGAHIDSKSPSPGGNDNASGSAAVLELARDVKGADIAPTIAFVLFGNEEAIDDDPDHHHYGSRAYVGGMTGEQRAGLVGMISLDMIGYGDTLNVRTMGSGPRKLSDMMRAQADAAAIGLHYLKDPSSVGYSDHEPFERAGYPSAWLEWRDDPAYHTRGDRYEHCDPMRIQLAGELVSGFLASLDDGDLEDLRAAKQ